MKFKNLYKIIFNVTLIFFFISLYFNKINKIIYGANANNFHFENVYRLYYVKNDRLSFKRKILYISRHEGTISNFCYVSEILGFDIMVLNPIYPHGERPKCYYRKDKCQYFVKSICFEFEYIIISDIIPDSYIFLINQCDAKIILEITNRFDWSIPLKYREDYYKTIAEAQKRNNIIFVENNPFEVYYLCTKKIFIRNYYLIRPLGNPPNNKIEEKHRIFYDKIAIFETYNQGKILSPILRNLNISYDVLGYKYGGPLILSSYKAIIILPYQVSIMKMMENFRYGIPMIIPTERFLREILGKYKINYPWIKYALNIPNGSKYYIEFYNNEFKDLFIYFDNFADLPDIIINTDFNSLKIKEKEFMKYHEKKTITMWSEVLDIKSIKKNIISNKKPLCNKINIFEKL